MALLILAGKEVVGRKLAIWKNRVGEWVNGKLVEFNPAKGQHKVRHFDCKPHYLLVLAPREAACLSLTRSCM
jgi:hypothetical protein